MEILTLQMFVFRYIFTYIFMYIYIYYIYISDELEFTIKN